MEIEGNFASYTSRSDPISAVIKIFYGSTPPDGSIYYQDAANDTPHAPSVVRPYPAPDTTRRA